MIRGYTSGVFDLFHIGHLNILRRSKEMCDYLIVGVSTDDLVFEYKGRKPVVPFSERVAIVEAIKYVGEVVPQITRDKVEALERLHFDIMFVGDDWKNSQLFLQVEGVFKAKGVDIKYFPYTKGTSSTLMRSYLEDQTALIEGTTK